MKRIAIVILILGLSSTTPALAQTLKYPVGMFGKFTNDGYVIQKIVPDSPAECAGLQVGDLIAKVDGQIVTSTDDFVSLLNSSGGSVVLIVRKGNNNRICRVGLDMTGKDKNGPPAPYFLGVIGSFTPDGMRVTTVIPCTPAAAAGVEKGDFIARVNKTVITNQDDFYKVLYDSGGSATLTIVKANGRTVRKEIDLTTYELGVLADFTKTGAVITQVAPLTPAAWVGLQKGDTIVSIDNVTPRSQKEFKSLLDNSGGMVSLVVQRPGGRPGRIFVELINNALSAWCEPDKEGMRIVAVIPGGPAEAIGLSRGDTILKIDDRKVRSQDELARALRSARGSATLTVRSGQTGRVVTVDTDLGR
jgi:S1-C subfamily serine protease